MFEKKFEEFWKNERECFSPEFIWTSEELAEVKKTL